ncbi:hypothetical protein GCM10010398_34140 [Streptomyces fimbriatus]
MKPASGRRTSCHGCPQTATPRNRPPFRPGTRPLGRPPASDRKAGAPPDRLPLTIRQGSANPAGQRTLPRGFNGTGLAAQANAFDGLKAILLDANRPGLFDDNPVAGIKPPQYDPSGW